MQLKNNINGEKAKFKTIFKYKIKDNTLTVNFVAYHSTFNSYSTIYNDKIYNGDVVEIFIGEKDSNQYYEIEVAPNNTLFFGQINYYDNQPHLNLLENNAITSKVKQVMDCYKVTINIDLNKLKLDKKSIVFNAFRIDTDGEKSNKYLFGLSPTMSETFHVPSAFISLR